MSLDRLLESYGPSEVSLSISSLSVRLDLSPTSLNAPDAAPRLVLRLPDSGDALLTMNTGDEVFVVPPAGDLPDARGSMRLCVHGQGA